MHTCIINKRSIDPRLNHQRFRYHITRLKKTREEQLMVFFFFLYSELFYVTTGERQIYKDFTNKKLKITIKSTYIFMFVLHNPFKTNVQEKFKIFKYSHHMMLLNWKQFIWRGRTQGDLYNRECSISIFIINLLSKICQSLHD